MEVLSFVPLVDLSKLFVFLFVYEHHQRELDIFLRWVDRIFCQLVG
jgi:hypothetical protein